MRFYGVAAALKGLCADRGDLARRSLHLRTSNITAPELYINSTLPLCCLHLPHHTPTVQPVLRSTTQQQLFSRYLEAANTFFGSNTYQQDVG